jgi:hypothetical protein
MPAPSLLRSKQRAYEICQLCKIAVEAGSILKDINYEIQQGIIDLNQLNYPAIGYADLDAQLLTDGAVTGEALINNYSSTLSRLAAYGT